MDKNELFRLLDGFLAKWGAQTNGIVDHEKHEKVQEYLDGLPENEFRLLMNEYIREYFVGEEATEQGYGIEDVKDFLRFLEDDFFIYL